MTCCNNRWSSSGKINNISSPNLQATSFDTHSSSNNNSDSSLNFIGLLMEFDDAYSNTLNNDFFTLSGITKKSNPSGSFQKSEPGLLDKASTFIKNTLNWLTESPVPTAKTTIQPFQNNNVFQF